MNRKYEDFLLPIENDQPVINIQGNKILKFSEYRKGSSEYGQLFQDLMMILRFKRDENKDNDYIILTKKDLKNIDYNKLLELTKDIRKMRKLGMSFDIEVLNNGNIKFYNMGNKESRPWENNFIY